MIFVMDAQNIIMDKQFCKECSHELKFHYRSHDEKTYCSQCNLKGKDCYAFEEWGFTAFISRFTFHPTSKITSAYYRCKS